MITPNEAQRFLTQATFGPTADTIDELVALGSFDAWITEQWDLPVSRTMPYAAANNNSNDNFRHYIWWKNLMDEPDQLRQRVAFALSEIFVVSDRDRAISNAQHGACQFYDHLAEFADGNFRELLGVITRHPVMGIYLSMLRNVRADPANNVRPDENFAREVLQLFTIGLYELNADGTLAGGGPTPTYDQDLIEEFARVFTGWNFNGETDFSSGDLTRFDKTVPMWAVEAQHDPGTKTLLGGQTNPAGLSAEADLDAALDNIVAHPNVGPFISRLLIQRLTTSNPTPAYVGRVAAAFNNNGSGERGDLGATVRAILVDTEARNGSDTMPDRFGKVKEPIMRLSQVWRAFRARVGSSAGSSAGPYYKLWNSHMLSFDDLSGQAVMRAQSVFNFFPPNHPVGGTDLVSPELAIHTEANVASMNNALWGQIHYYNNLNFGHHTNVVIDIDREVALIDTPNALIDHLDGLLLGGTMSPGMRSAMQAHLAGAGTGDDNRYEATLDAIFLVAGSPHFMVQR